jgi:nanoRNase/pAp phosphatase (c-di-AMP/oligoRNAs hydrolase)
VVLTHATADFDSLAAAVALARLWTEGKDASFDDVPVPTDTVPTTNNNSADVPTFVVLPRGAHPGVQRFLALHKHLFPIRSLKSLPPQGLRRLALVDAQRRDRLGPAESLLAQAQRVTVVDHHMDQESDIFPDDYVVDKVGSVSTLLTEFLQKAALRLTEAEATLMALGIHADTGSLCFDSTTPRDAAALAWCLQQGASQPAIAEHAHPFLSREQQGVLTQALVSHNATTVQGVTLSTVLLTADGFINGLAAVTQDALELSSSDVFLFGLVYEAQSGGRRKKGRKQAGSLLTSRLLPQQQEQQQSSSTDQDDMRVVDANDRQRRQRLRQAFDRKDTDYSGSLDVTEVASALTSSGVIASPDSIQDIFASIDTNQDGRIDFEEFVAFADQAERAQEEQNEKKATTLILIGRAKAGSHLRAIKLNALLEKFGGGGHAKAASATVRLNDEKEAPAILQGLVDELIETSLQEQLTVGDFMTAPVLSVKSDMTETQVEDLFTRYDVRALPVVDEGNDVIGLVTYKEVASAKVSGSLLQSVADCDGFH